MGYGRVKSRQSDIAASAGPFLLTGVFLPWPEHPRQQHTWDTCAFGRDFLTCPQGMENALPSYGVENKVFVGVFVCV